MNRAKEFRQIKGLTLSSVAKAIGIDDVLLGMFEHGKSFITLDNAYDLAEVLEAPIGDIFPLLKSVLAEASKFVDEEEWLDFVYASENMPVLFTSHIEPADVKWFADIQLRSGAERRYLLNSHNYQMLRTELQLARSEMTHLTFHSDCQDIVLRMDAVVKIEFSNEGRHVPYSSIGNEHLITIVTNTSIRPITMMVNAEYGEEGAATRPFGSMLQEVDETGSCANLYSFMLIQERLSEIFIPLDSIEIIEVPVCVTRPEYTFDEIEELSAATALGNA